MAQADSYGCAQQLVAIKSQKGYVKNKIKIKQNERHGGSS